MAHGSDPTGNGFLVEDFIHSITTQLDRVQDALRIKAVNRPLTYALKELHLELKVFVDLDPNGNVRLRASGPNEAGASVLSMDFTTITKPMIEENTISLAATRSTPLDSLGLSGEEQSRLERLGVTNLAQLDRLKGSTGVSTVARMADVPVDRLRQALQVGRPQVKVIRPAPVKTQPRPAPVPKAPPKPMPKTLPATQPGKPPVVVRPPVIKTPGGIVPPKAGQPGTRPAPIVRPAPPFVPAPPARKTRVAPPPRTLDAQAWTLDQPEDDDMQDLVIGVPAGSRSLTLEGANLLHDEHPTQVTLNGEALAIDELDHDRLVVRLPQGFAEGPLEVRLGDGAPALTFSLVHEDGTDTFDALDGHEDGETGDEDSGPYTARPFADDPWAPVNAHADGGDHEA